MVTAVAETLNRSNLDQKKEGDELNLEQSLRVNDRLDGHLVQGHVDAVAVCKKIKEKNGSWVFTFRIRKDNDFLLVNKGSVAVNGVSLTIVKPSGRKFSVAIIPYTYAHTNFKSLKVGEEVNIEFDIIGKYVQQILTGKTVQ
jgi:riboflavin synthase